MDFNTFITLVALTVGIVAVTLSLKALADIKRNERDQRLISKMWLNSVYGKTPTRDIDVNSAYPDTDSITEPPAPEPVDKPVVTVFGKEPTSVYCTDCHEYIGTILTVLGEHETHRISITIG